MERLFSITEIASENDVTPRAVRFYEDKGLLAPRRVGNRRVYTAREAARLKLILRGKRLGFALSDIREYLDLYDQDPTQVEQLKHLMGKVRARIEALEAQRRDLDEALAELMHIETQARDALDQRLDQRKAS